MSAMSSTRHSNCGGALAALPLPAFADGGISALGALLPAFVAMGLLGVATVGWLIFSLVVAFSSPAKLSERKLKVYRFSSGFLIGILIVLALFGVLMSSMPAVLVLLAQAGIVAWITSLVVTRARGRIAATTE